MRRGREVLQWRRMIRRTRLLDEFERDWIANFPRDPDAALRIYQALHDEAVALGVLPPKDPLEGIEIDIALARFFNDRPPAR